MNIKTFSITKKLVYGLFISLFLGSITLAVYIPNTSPVNPNDILTANLWNTMEADLRGLATEIAANVKFTHGNNTSQAVYNLGNVGIGTTNPSEKLDVHGNIIADAYIYSSDRKLKEQITTINNPLVKLGALRGVNFTWKKNQEQSIGFIAQEVEIVLPQLVHTNSITGLKAVEYGNITALLVEATKELQKEVNLLKEENKLLNAKIESLIK